MTALGLICWMELGCGVTTPEPLVDAGHDADSESDTDIEPDGDHQADADLEPSPQEQHLVVVTLNTHSFQEGDDSLDKLDWIGRGLTALEADLIGLNEVMSGTFRAYDFHGAEYDGAELIRDALEDASGVSYHMARCGFAHWDDGEEMSNVALSRYPIEEWECRSLTTTDFWPAPEERRNVLYTRLEVPRLGEVNFFVTHTSGYGSSDTEPQITEIRQMMVERFRGDEALDLLVGDLNTVAGSEAYDRWLRADPFTLHDTFARANPEDFFASTQIDGGDRIDYILAGEGFALTEQPGRYVSAIVFDGGPSQGVLLPVVSDHKGVVTVFSLVVD
jgi:endonuclease/exonuclease/phosphatase family metal-dependent hydrolase